jgi:outer membrane lipoprotein-sorting protein
MNREPVPPEEIERLLAGEPDSLPPELEARMRARLHALERRIDAASVPAPERKEGWLMSVIRNLNQGRVRWTAAAALAAVIVAVYVVAGGGPSQSGYAAAVERLHNAASIAFRMKIVNVPNVAPVELEIQHKQSGATRLRMTGGIGGETIVVVNPDQGKMLTLLPGARTAVLKDADADAGKGDDVSYLSELKNLQTLPARADAAMFGDLDGRRARIYLLKGADAEKYLWLDDATGDLVRYTIDYAKGADRTHIEMTGFRFDQPMDDALFSTAIPSGFIDASAAAPAPDSATEQDLVKALKACVDGLGSFPAVLDPTRPFETAQALGAGLKESLFKRGRAGEPDIDAKAMKEGMALGAIVSYLTKLGAPGHDFRYAGETIKPGSAADWIAWWKPDGSATYRVIRGDLTVADETPEAVAAHATAR